MNPRFDPATTPRRADRVLSRRVAPRGNVARALDEASLFENPRGNVARGVASPRGAAAPSLTCCKV